MNITWLETDNYIQGTTDNYNLTNTKVASFDFDDTLVTSIKKFSDEWTLYDESVPAKLLDYVNDGYRLVILSNQKGIGLGKTDSDTWKSKVNDFYKLINIPFMIVASITDSEYRKPLTKMWSLINGDITTSFFCGDAGNLPKRVINNKNIDKDFSDTDLKFALNLGVKFMHRDEFIFGVKQTCVPNYPNLDNKSECPEIVLQNRSVVINVGYPGSGKSSFVNTRYPNAIIVNQDTLKTKAKCMSLYKTSLKNNINLIIIDNTNPSIDIRKEYIELAKINSYHIMCFNFQTSKELSKHNNHYRAFTTNTKLVPTIAYNIHGKKYNVPTVSEGFDKIYHINFNNTCEDAKYNMYYF